MHQEDIKNDKLNWWQFIIWMIIPLMLYSYFIVPDAYNLLFARNDKVIIADAAITETMCDNIGSPKSCDYYYKLNYQTKNYKGDFTILTRYTIVSSGSQIKVYFNKDDPENSKPVFILIFWAVFGLVMIFAYILASFKKIKIISRALRMKKYQGNLVN